MTLFKTKYEELLLADRWVPTKKRQSAFTMGDPKTRTFVEADKDKAPKPPKKDDKPRDRPTHDKKGNLIDYSPPKSGQPHERTKNGKTEYPEPIPPRIFLGLIFELSDEIKIPFVFHSVSEARMLSKNEKRWKI